MKLHKFWEMNNVKTEAEEREFCRIHRLGIYSCIVCDEILDDPTKPCPACTKKRTGGKMKTEITEFRGVKFGETSQEVTSVHDYSGGIQWWNKKEDPKIGVIRVSEIRYGFYKGKFMAGRVKFGGEETYIILLTALTEKYGDPTSARPGNIWNVGNVSIYLRFNPESQVDEGSLSYEFTPLAVELKEELDKKKKEEMKMKVNAAKSDL